MLKTVSSVTNAIGALNFKGTWNASTNTPTIVSGVGVKGDYFVVSVAGSTTIDGISNWGIGDWIVYNGALWQRVEGGADLNGVNLSVSGTTTLSNLTASTALALNASKEVASVTNTGSGNNVLATSPTLTTPNIGDATGTQLNIDNVRLDGNRISTTNTNGNLEVIPDGSGVFLVNKTSVNPFNPNAHVILSDETVDGSGVLIIENLNGTNGTTAFFGVAAAGVGYNASICALGVYRCNTNSRSINAAGSINASGLDYAEYMRKAGDFTIAKGDVVGINAQGLLTNVFADAVAFVVKSTDPSYVGGDVWGREDVIGVKNPSELKKEENDTDAEWQIKVDSYKAKKAVFDAALEAARQTVDRIAFAGQVPVNVAGASPGQYIVPINDNGAIKGIAMSEQDMQLKDYMAAVGRVIAVESDGRAKIIVKTA